MGALDKMKLSRGPTDTWERELLVHCVPHRTSFLAAKHEGQEEDHDLEVLQNGGRWYLGTIDEAGIPLSRDSEYFPTEEEAKEALRNYSWTQRMDP
jgi:hypothetical protein